MEIETNRLILRAFNEEDFEDYYEAISPYTESERKKYTFLKAVDLSLKGIKNIKKLLEPESEFHCLFRFSEIDEYRRSEKERFFSMLKSTFDYAIVLKPVMKVVGKVSFSKPAYYCPEQYRYKKSKEIGVVLHQKVRNQGLMTEAVSTLVNAVFDETDVQAVYSRILEDNAASLRLFEKCGFKYLYKREELVGLGSKMVVTKGITKEDEIKAKVETISK